MPYENYAQWKIVPISEEPKLSIVIPAYNERERIVATIGAIASHVSDLGFPWEMFIADDGSKDDTVAIVEELGLVNLTVLKAPKNGGKGSAVQRGMLAARGKYVLFADADNSTPLKKFQNFSTNLSMTASMWLLAHGPRKVPKKARNRSSERSSAGGCAGS